MSLVGRQPGRQRYAIIRVMMQLWLLRGPDVQLRRTAYDLASAAELFPASVSLDNPDRCTPCRRHSDPISGDWRRC